MNRFSIFFFVIISILGSCFPNEEDSLYDLARNNNFARLKELLDRDTLLLNATDETGYSPLSYAVKNQNIEMIKYLIEKGASVNYYKYVSVSPIYLALTTQKVGILPNNAGIDSTRKERIIKILVRNGLSIDERTPDGDVLLPLIQQINDSNVKNLVLEAIIDGEKPESDLVVINLDDETFRKIPLVQKTTITRIDNAISFTVNDVKPAIRLIKEKDYELAVKDRDISNIIYCNPMDYRLVPSSIHPFLGAVQKAYYDHRPLTLSPDVIWLMICQGFAKHIELNCEKYRNQIVNFMGIRTINISGNDIIKEKTNDCWPQLIEQFSTQVKENIIDTVLHSVITHSFSTSSEKELIAAEVTFLEANKQYFELNYSACGIPEIVLEGTTDDWIWIRNNLAFLKKFEMDWWIKKLIPIMDEFVESSNGNVNLKFWSKIYRFDPMCGSEIAGWFANFFPYIRYGESEFVQNKLVLNEPLYSDEKYVSGLTNEDFVSGLSYVDFNYIRPGEVIKMSFISGFVGIKQDEETLALKPEINWLVVKK